MIFNEGTYAAKVVSHAINETDAGLPQAVITFEFNHQGKASKITWYGSFKEAARKHTIKALLVCGLKGNNPAGDLEIGREVSIVIENEEYQGKERSRVRWVNATNVVRNVIPQEQAVAKLADLAGAVMAARQENGATSEDDEIPF